LDAYWDAIKKVKDHDHDNHGLQTELNEDGLRFGENGEVDFGGEEQEGEPKEGRGGWGGEHPIPVLLQRAEDRWNEMVQRESQTLEDAVEYYEKQWGRRPPSELSSTLSTSPSLFLTSLAFACSTFEYILTRLLYLLFISLLSEGFDAWYAAFPPSARSNKQSSPLSLPSLPYSLQVQLHSNSQRPVSSFQPSRSPVYFLSHLTPTLPFSMPSFETASHRPINLSSNRPFNPTTPSHPKNSSGGPRS